MVLRRLRLKTKSKKTQTLQSQDKTKTRRNVAKSGTLQMTVSLETEEKDGKLKKDNVIGLKVG